MNYRDQIERESDKAHRNLLVIMILSVFSAGFMVGAVCMGYAIAHRQQAVDVNAPVRIVPPSELEMLPDGTKQVKPTPKPTPRFL